MKKMLVIIFVLAFVLLLAGCLQPQSPPVQNGSIAAQACIKTPNMAWCDKEQKCIDPAVENCV